MEQATQDTAPVRRLSLPKKEAQDLANRIWEGQSSSLPRNERMKRIKAALEARGMNFALVVLP